MECKPEVFKDDSMLHYSYYIKYMYVYKDLSWGEHLNQIHVCP